MTSKNLMSRSVTLLVSFLLLCLFGGTAWAADDQTWPVETDLMIKDWMVDEPDVFLNIGKVYFVNSRDELKIVIEPDEQFMITQANVHVEFSDDFESVLDKKTGIPKPGKFDFKTNYLADQEIRVAKHEQVVPFQFLEDKFDRTVCWGMNEEKCPPFYAIVAVTLQIPGDEEGEWVDVSENAYATNGGQFDRYGDELPHIWGHYVTYLKAKPLAGHFVDANVNGLSYATRTQSGITTSSGETGNDGQFWFVTGERIGFSVGSLFIGETLADRVLSPVELFPGAIMDEDDRVANLARLLQSLDADGVIGRGAINITDEVVGCLESALDLLELRPSPSPDVFFADDAAVGGLISATHDFCSALELTEVTKTEALENLNLGMQAGNLMKRNISKTPDLADDKAKIEIMPVYVPAQRPDGTATTVMYFDENGDPIEDTGRTVAKPIVVTYVGEDELTGASDVYVAISRDDGDSWKRRNVSRTAGKSSMQTLDFNASEPSDYPGGTAKPMLKVKDNMIFVAWTGKYCKGGRPGYAINVCPDTDADGIPDPCDICRTHYDELGNPVEECETDYPGDDDYWADDLYGVAGPQRSVDYEGEDGMGEVPYSCVWTARATIDADTGNIQWFKPERVTSGRRDAYQLFAGAGEDVAFGIVWQEDPRGLMPGEGDGPGDGWSGANTHSKTDIWYSYITMEDFAKVDWDYPVGGHGDNEDLVDQDPELAGRVKALVPMSLPVRISDNDVCSAENIAAEGGGGEHDPDHEFEHDGEGTHRYCGTLDGIGTVEEPGTNLLCAYTLEKINPQGVPHNVCVTQDGRYLDGNTGASRANLFLQPYCSKKDPLDDSICLQKSAWAIIGYEESKGVGTPPEEEEGCGDEDVALATDTEGEDDDHEDRYKPDSGKNVIFHSFKFDEPQAAASGGILNLPETDQYGEPVYLVNEDGSDFEDWQGNRVLAYENARRVRFITQPKSKAVFVDEEGFPKPGTVLVALYRQGEEGGGKPADIFMRRITLFETEKGNPYAFSKFECDLKATHVDTGDKFCIKGARNLSSVESTLEWQNPFDAEAPVKMLRWGWTPANLDDSSAENPYTDSRAHRGTLNGDDLIIGYTWTPNWGRKANDKYDFYVRRSFNGGGTWTTDPDAVDEHGDPMAIEHNVVFRVPIEDADTQTVIWDEEVVTTVYAPGASEPPRNVSNLRNYRTSVMEPRLVKTPGTIKTGGKILYPEDKWDPDVYQIAFGTEFNQNASPNDVNYPKMPLDIMYGRTRDKGQHFESVIVTRQGGGGKPEEGMNPLAQDDYSEQGAAQLRQTPDGSRMYGIWLEETKDQGGQVMSSDIMFRRVDYRGADE